jgi:hypothetical protein
MGRARTLGRMREEKAGPDSELGRASPATLSRWRYNAPVPREVVWICKSRLFPSFHPEQQGTGSFPGAPEKAQIGVEEADDLVGKL